VDGVRVQDETGFAAAIEKVSQMSFGNLREEALERFSFEKMIERSLAVYRELASPHG
jgi:glycosyltransferase involved in cell wall biosynthesis